MLSNYESINHFKCMLSKFISFSNYFWIITYIIIEAVEGTICFVVFFIQLIAHFNGKEIE